MLGTLTNLSAQWQLANVPTERNIQDIVFLDKNIGYAVSGHFISLPNQVIGGELLLTTDGGELLLTTDGGENWTVGFENDSISLRDLLLVEKDSHTELHIYGLKSFSEKYLITVPIDNLTERQIYPIDYTVDSPLSYDGSIYFIDNDDFLLKKVTDNVVTILSDEYVELFDVNENGIMYFEIDATHIKYRSHDTEDWTTMTSVPESTWSSEQIDIGMLRYFENSIDIFSTYSPYYSHSENFGESWMEHPTSFGYRLLYIVNDSLSFGRTTAGFTIGKSIDRGQSYVIQDTLAEFYDKIYFYNDNLGFIGCRNGLIYRTDNGGGSIVGTSDPQSSLEKILIYPNPVKDILYFDVSKLSDYHIKVYDAVGKQMMDQKLAHDHIKIKELSPDQYTYRLFRDGIWVATDKFMVL